MQIKEKFMDAQCFQCKHLNFNPVEFNCPAFEEGDPIPEDILTNDFIHDHFHPKQKTTIVFQKKEPDNTD